MTELALFNLVEAVWWGIVAVVIAITGGRARDMTPRVRWGLAAAFLAFGVSDLIEIATGAWWRPLGLLLLKAACVCGIVAGLASWFAARRTRTWAVTERSESRAMTDSPCRAPSVAIAT